MAGTLDKARPAARPTPLAPRALREYLLRAEPRADTAAPAETTYLAIALSVLAAAWLSLALGELGLFSAGLVGALWLFLALLAALVARRRGGWRALARPRPGPTDLLFGLALIAAAVYYSRPFEFILGGFDPGAYVDTGANLARTGSLLVHDRDALDLPPDLRAALFSEPSASPAVIRRLEGFYFVDEGREVVAPHGFHLYPSLLGLGYSLGGIWAELQVTPLLTLLSLTALYLLGRRLLGPPVGLLAAVLLMANFAQTWFGRYPAAEVMVQFLFLSGLLALVLMLDTKRKRFGVAAGLLLGAAHLTKVEVVFLPLVVAAFGLYEWRSRRLGPEHWCLLGAYALGAAHALAHAWLFSRPYSLAHFAIGLEALERLGVVGLVLAGLAVLGLVWLLWPRGETDAPRRGEVPAGRLRVALAVAVCLLAAYAYFVRPLVGPPGLPDEASSAASLAAVANRESLIRLGWYVTPPGVLLGVLGCAVLLASSAGRRHVVLLAAVLLDTVWWLYEGKINPVHFWAARRWLPIVIPGFVLFGSYFVVWLGRRLRWRWPGLLVAVGLAALVLGSSVAAGLPLLRHKEYAGAVQQVGELAWLFPENAVVLFDDDDPGRRLSAPLQYIWGRTSVVVRRDTPAEAAVGAAVAHWQRQGRPVYWVKWVRDGHVASSEMRGVEMVPTASAVIDLAEVIVTTDRRPSAIGEFRTELRVFAVLDGS